MQTVLLGVGLATMAVGFFGTIALTIRSVKRGGGGSINVPKWPIFCFVVGLGAIAFALSMLLLRGCERQYYKLCWLEGWLDGRAFKN